MDPDRLPLLPRERAAAAPPWHVDRWFGAPVSLADLRGRVVVLHAFQMLCPGCVLHGVPQAARVHAAFDASEVAVVGLHTVFEHHGAMGPDALEAFLHEFRVPFSVAVDAHAGGRSVPRTMEAYGLRGTPSLVLIDREGRLRASVFGRPSDLAVGAAVATLVAEAPVAALDAPVPEQKPPETDPARCDDTGCRVL